ncbi:MAG: HNH endonuclease domain-containing protein [Bryobacteraceae bacterium]
MQSHQPTNGLNFALIVGAVILVWYLYQIASRKTEIIRFKARRMIVGLLLYIGAATVLLRQGLPSIEAVTLSALAGLGSAWLLVNPPKQSRRIPKAIREQVIARDLTSKGLKWDSKKYHIDHVVPFSRGGDNSVRNLRVVEKHKNLRKGGKMPGLGDLF